MDAIKEAGYSQSIQALLNRVHLHQHVVFLSDVLVVSGRTLDERYLLARAGDGKWSSLDFLNERPPWKDFRLWNQVLHQLVPSGGLHHSLGRLLYEEYKIWG